MHIVFEESKDFKISEKYIAQETEPKFEFGAMLLMCLFLLANSRVSNYTIRNRIFIERVYKGPWWCMALVCELNLIHGKIYA